MIRSSGKEFTVPACDPNASTAYFLSVASAPSKRSSFREADMTGAFVREVEELREEIRAEEGGGGMCHVVSEVMGMRRGWPMLSVAYLSPDGGMICAAHVVSVLPDGSIMDHTRDQFGEGHSVSFVKAGSDEIGRYRPEFYEDFHPGHPDDTDGQMTPWLDTYSGRTDSDEQDAVRAERGRGWWLSDLTLLDEYEERQERYARPIQRPGPAF